MKKLYGKDRVKIIDDVELFLCNRCGEWQEKSEYYKNNRCYMAVDSTCIPCRKDKNLEKFKGKSPLEYHGVVWEVKGAKKVLERMGYDLDYNIHEQFLLRNKDRMNL